MHAGMTFADRNNYSLIEIIFIATCLAQITIPEVDTTYWCAAFRLPEEIRTQTRYVTKVYKPEQFHLVNVTDLTDFFIFIVWSYCN